MISAGSQHSAMAIMTQRIAPKTTRPGGMGRSLSTASALTDLPHPDSPTRATISPFSTSYEMPLTAWRMPKGVRKELRHAPDYTSCE